jgi:hypothetical protein
MSSRGGPGFDGRGCSSLLGVRPFWRFLDRPIYRRNCGRPVEATWKKRKRLGQSDLLAGSRTLRGGTGRPATAGIFGLQCQWGRDPHVRRIFRQLEPGARPGAIAPLGNASNRCRFETSSQARRAVAVTDAARNPEKNRARQAKSGIGPLRDRKNVSTRCQRRTEESLLNARRLFQRPSPAGRT